MYLRDSYFREIERWPTVDLLDGYFTIISPKTYEDIHPVLRREIFRLRSMSTFEYFFKGEETFNGSVNTGPSDNWLEIAWCAKAGIAAVLYNGEGIPPRVKWCEGDTVDLAIDEWCETYVVPIHISQDESDGK